MHYTETDLPRRAAVLSAVRDAFGLALDDDGSLAAYAEAVAFSDNLPAVLMLAEAIDSEVWLFGADAFTVDASALIKIHGNAMVSLALRLADVARVDIGARTFWRVGDAGANDPTLKLDADLLAKWAEHYQ